MFTWKFKSIPALVCLASASLVAIPISAHAQVIGVTDVAAERILQDIDDNTDTIEDKLETANKFATEKTEPYYKHELARLDRMIELLGHYEVSEDGKTLSASEKNRITELYKSRDGDLDNREAVSDASKGESEQFAIIVKSGDSGSPFSSKAGVTGGGPLQKYMTAHNFTVPEEIFKDATKKIHIEKLYSALYMAEVTAGEVNEGRENRLEIYKDLSEKSKAAKDMRQALEINNAIQLENGRNLAMLINLETAQLNAQSVNLRQTAQTKQGKTDLFGSNALGIAALSGILAFTQ